MFVYDGSTEARLTMTLAKLGDVPQSHTLRPTLCFSVVPELESNNQVLSITCPTGEFLFLLKVVNMYYLWRNGKFRHSVPEGD